MPSYSTEQFLLDSRFLVQDLKPEQHTSKVTYNLALTSKYLYYFLSSLECLIISLVVFVHALDSLHVIYLYYFVGNSEYLLYYSFIIGKLNYIFFFFRMLLLNCLFSAKQLISSLRDGTLCQNIKYGGALSAPSPPRATSNDLNMFHMA